jgi:hypothetical protein
MSKDKHKGVQRRKFALANAEKVLDSPCMTVTIAGSPSIKTRNSAYPPRERYDITKDIKKLEKQGKLKRYRKRITQDGSRTKFKPV